MINVFISNAVINEADLHSALTPKFEAAVKAGAQVGKEAHEDIVKEWRHQPDVSVDGPKSDGKLISADVIVTDSADSWWEAVNFGSTSPPATHLSGYMIIGPYDAFSQPGDPYSGAGEKSYDGIIASRNESVIAARDFIDWVFKNKGQKVIDAMAQELA